MHGTDVFENVGRALAAMGPARARVIVGEVSRKHGVNPKSLMEGYRYCGIVKARMEVVYRLRTEIEWSFTRIGMFLGRDHTSIIHLYRKYLWKFHGGPAPKHWRSGRKARGVSKYANEEHRRLTLAHKREQYAQRKATDPLFEARRLEASRRFKFRARQTRLLMAMM